MTTETIQLPEKPVIFEEVRCPECGQNITKPFNSFQFAVFNRKRIEYNERKQKTHNVLCRKPSTQTLEIIERYEQGKITETFVVSCGGCEAKLKFIMHNTRTGETTMQDGRPILIVHPNPNAKVSETA